MSGELEVRSPVKSIVEIKVGNRTYPMIRVKNCHTCMHPARILIEEKILLDYSFPSIAEQFSDKEFTTPDGETVKWPAITSDVIRAHYKNGHCAANATVVREYSEQLKSEAGVDVEAVIKPVAHHKLVTEAIIERTWERLMKGEIDPDLKDGLAAIKLKTEITKAEGLQTQQDVSVWQTAMRIYMEEVTKLLDENQAKSLRMNLQNNKELAQLEQAIRDTESQQ